MCKVSSQYVTACLTSASISTRLTARCFLSVQRDGNHQDTHSQKRATPAKTGKLRATHLYSPDLSLNDFRRFGPRKQNTAGKRFAGDGQLKQPVISRLNTQHRFLPHRDKRHNITTQHMLKCQSRMSGDVVCTTCYTRAKYTSTSE